VPPIPSAFEPLDLTRYAEPASTRSTLLPDEARYNGQEGTMTRGRAIKRSGPRQDRLAEERTGSCPEWTLPEVAVEVGALDSGSAHRAGKDGRWVVGCQPARRCHRVGHHAPRLWRRCLPEPAA
jgi:hypothetical protein